MNISDTLLVRRLPVCLSKLEIEDFLKYIGAVNVRVFESKVKKQTAFAKFKSEDAAREALFRLHQQILFGSKLVVEFAYNSDWKGNQKQVESEEKTEIQEFELQQEFIRQLNNWTTGLNFMLPPPCHLNYRYPSPTAEVLLNIVSALSSNTKFYTQVLHLMNKMNLHSPFEDSYPMQHNEVFNSFILYILQNAVYEDELNEKMKESSEEGSELESETEDLKAVSKLPQKRPMSNRKILKRKKLFKAITVSSKSDSNLKSISKSSIDDVFEKVDLEPTKKIDVRMPSEITSIESSSNIEEGIGFGLIVPPEKQTEEESKKDEDKGIEKCITEEELAKNRLNERDRRILSVFKNYDPGVPSCRLYIKNLSKHVTVPDLQYIYKRYFVKGVDEQGTMFDIRLMQEGRMKGQAFVTLQNVEQSKLAVKETNGFIIKDKPMVVQFARSAATK